MRDDVIDFSGNDNDVMAEMKLAEGMRLKVPLSGFLPSIVVQTLS